MTKIMPFLLAIFALSACSDNGVSSDQDRGILCPANGKNGELQYIVKNFRVCYRNDAVIDLPNDALICKSEDDCCGLDVANAREYIFAFENNACPTSYECAHEDGINYCTYLRCPIGFHDLPYSDGCEVDSDTACGSYDNNCLEYAGVYIAECNFGVCDALYCDSQFHQVKNANGTYKCVVDSVEECPIYDEKGEVVYDDDGSVSVQKCESHIEDGEFSAICTDQGCKIKSCATSYHLDRESAHCELDSFEHCGAWYNDCRVDGKLSGWCDLKNDEYLCVAQSCEEGYTLIRGECLPNNNDHCGLDSKGNVISCASNYVCDSMNAKCIKTGECTNGQLFCENACINPQNNRLHCGGCFNRCDGECIDGRCTSNCPDGFADCDEYEGCEIDLKTNHLASCSQCLNGYYDINYNILDGCELELNQYGLDVNKEGELICGSFTDTQDGKTVERDYTQCGEYKIQIGIKKTSIPLCLNYLFNEDVVFKKDGWCESLCNSNSKIGTSVHSNHFNATHCEPLQTCYPGPLQTECFGKDNEHCYDYIDSMCK